MTTINTSMACMMDSATQHSNAMTKDLANLQKQVASQAVVRTMPTSRGTTADGQMQRMAMNMGQDDVVSFKSKLTPEEAAKNLAQLAAYTPTPSALAMQKALSEAAASDMAIFTKGQILTQPGTAILAQANSQAQAVLSLIK